MTPQQLAAGQRWARGYHRRHPRARTDQDRWAAFETAEEADEQERWRRS